MRQRFTAAEVAEAATESYGLVTLAAKRLGCTSRTIHLYAVRYRSVREAIELARAASLDLAEQALFAAVERQEPWAVQFLLRGPGRVRGYGEKYVEMRVRAEEPAKRAAPEIDYDDFNRRTREALRLVARVERGEALEDEGDTEGDPEEEPGAG